MALETAPAPTVGNIETLKSYRPPDAETQRYYRTKTDFSDTLENIAQRTGFTVKELIAFNFPGSVVNDQVVPGVVNWYLHHHWQFHCPETQDRQNRVFRGNESIAIPYRKTFIEFVDPMVVEAKSPAVPGVWIGGGYKAGTTFGVFGNETAQIVCVALDGRQGFTATITGSRIGLGVGASGGPIAVLITSMRSAHDLARLNYTGGMDFSLAVGPKLDFLFNGSKTTRALRAISNFAEKYGKRGEQGLKACRTLVKYNGQVIDIVKAFGMKFDHYEPQIFSLGIPWGGFGAEASWHHTVSQYHVEAVQSF